MSLQAIRTLLDAEAIAGLARRLPCLEAERVGEATLSALWVKPGRHFNVLYTFGGTDDPILVSGFSLDPSRADAVMSKLGPHRCDDGGRMACRPCSTLRADGGIILQRFPFDYRLPTLPDCLNTAKVQLSLDAKAAITECRPTGYRPGMRCQIRYRFADGSLAFGKVAVEREPGRVFHLQERLYAGLDTRAGHVRAARPWRYSDDLRLTVLHAACGENLDDTLAGGKNLDGPLRAVAQALGDFHCLRIEGIDRVYRPADEIPLLSGWATLIGELQPSLAPLLRASHEFVEATQPPAMDRHVLVHRDFYEKQVLLTPDHLTFLDLDTVCWGDPEIDLGNFCAHLRLRALQSGCPDWSPPLEEVFLAAYPHAVVKERVAWYRRSTLLRLACVYALRPPWRWLAPALAAEAIGTDGGDARRSNPPMAGTIRER